MTRTRQRSQAPAICLLVALASAAWGQHAVGFARRSVAAGGRRFTCNVVTVDLQGGHVRAHLVTALGGIGRTEPFDQLVRRTHPLAAINGSFFDAYKPQGDKDPNQTLIQDGQVIHKGSTGTVIGFAGRRVVMGRLELPIRGSVEEAGGRVIPWVAYWLNRTPEAPDNVVICTPARGARARVPDGISVVVDHNVATRVVHGDAAIPPLGYVINFRGPSERAARPFAPGARVGFAVEIRPDTDFDAWQRVSDGVGAGPRLVTNGRVTVDPVSEGFSSPKILSNGGQRSAIGVTRDGRILLVTVSGPTILELANVMRSLGAWNAMNLDGGASSALYCNGAFITSAGRPLSNVLEFLPN